MPVHDWKKVDAGLFHSFHQRWISYLSDALNSGPLPEDYYALPEQRVHGPIPDILTLKLSNDEGVWSSLSGGLAVETAPPHTRFEIRREEQAYVEKANRIAVRHKNGDLVSVIEIVSPGNKNSLRPFENFVEMAVDFLRIGVHVMIIDLLPPTKRDPYGIHHEIWKQFEESEPKFLPEKPLTLVSYDAGPEMVAYYEPIAVGDVMPDMPLFLRPEIYIPCPLESTYLATWKMFPRQLKPLLEGP
jgi:hypothetical protein